MQVLTVTSSDSIKGAVGWRGGRGRIEVQSENNK
jgi:hypothetical protein